MVGAMVGPTTDPTMGLLALTAISAGTPPTDTRTPVCRTPGLRPPAEAQKGTTKGAGAA